MCKQYVCAVEEIGNVFRRRSMSRFVVFNAPSAQAATGMRHADAASPQQQQLEIISLSPLVSM